MTPQLLAGRYRLVHVLGRGGMGAVWQAHDILLEREVAIKEIHGLPVGDDETVQVAVRRALREAQATARLKHPGIVLVHDVVVEDERPWIVMELVHGPSLAQVVERDGALSVQRAAAIGIQVLEALDAAHRLGIRHRDVKPGNILLDGERAVLTDFGIATFDGATGLTATGQVIGSPEYLAPERITGGDVGAAADLWAVGVTLCVMVTGDTPFRRSDAQATIAAVLAGLSKPPTGVGPLWPAIKGLLESDPRERLTAAQAVRLLSAVVSVVSGPGLGSPVRKARSSKTAWLSAIPILAILILAGALAWSGPNGSADTSHRNTRAKEQATTPLASHTPPPSHTPTPTPTTPPSSSRSLPPRRLRLPDPNSSTSVTASASRCPRTGGPRSTTAQPQTTTRQTSMWRSKAVPSPAPARRTRR
ncbi:serine/threonine-protein kinase [Catenulispora yoronensis]